MGFQRGIRIITPPIEAIFPIPLSEKYPYPDDQTFKSITVESIVMHFMDGHELRVLTMPKGMRSFSKLAGDKPVRAFDAGLPFMLDGKRCVLNFHLSYDIEKKILDGYVDYLPTPQETKINFIELEYHISFTPS